MKAKIFFLLLFSISFAYGSLSTVAVSPFVNRGFSFTNTFAFFPIWDNNYGTESDYDNFLAWGVRYHDGMIIKSERAYRRNFIFANDYSIGIRERVEIRLAHNIFLGILFEHFLVSCQIKTNVFHNGDETTLFRNISVSPFIGYLYKYSDEVYKDFYGGISFGTKYTVNERINLELYSSPMIYKSEYIINNFPNADRYYGKGTFLTLNIPVGARMLIGRTRKFSYDFGITPVIHLRDTWMKTSPVAVFTKMSFHLGRKKPPRQSRIKSEEGIARGSQFSRPQQQFSNPPLVAEEEEK